MKTKLASLFGAALLLAGGSGVAGAGTISTPIIFLGGGSQLICIANNVTAQSVAMTVTIVGSTSNGTQSCTLSPSDRFGCQAFLNGQLGHCRISVTGISNEQVRARLRGVLFNRITTSPFTIFTTVEAR